MSKKKAVEKIRGLWFGPLRPLLFALAFFFGGAGANHAISLGAAADESVKAVESVLEQSKQTPAPAVGGDHG